VDITEPEFSGAQVLLRSVLEVSADELLDALGGPADVVLSDMAPRTTGNPLGDHVEQLMLATRAAELAKSVLRPGGHFVVKVFDGEDAHAYVQEVRADYDKHKRVRPEAVRRESREFFLVCTGFRSA
jgi:23S rRNA (uridine2552-2'-O)-methyltransferase